MRPFTDKGRRDVHCIFEPFERDRRKAARALSHKANPTRVRGDGPAYIERDAIGASDETLWVLTDDDEIWSLEAQAPAGGLRAHLNVSELREEGGVNDARSHAGNDV